MKNEWYECRVKYEKKLDAGEQKKVTETYVVKAVSVSDAEKRVIGELKPYISGEFAVKSVKVANFKEIFQNDEEKFYLTKVMLVTFDDDTGAEKKTAHVTLVQAADFEDALKNLKAGLKSSLSDYELFSIAESPIVGIVE